MNGAIAPGPEGGRRPRARGAARRGRGQGDRGQDRLGGSTRCTPGKVINPKEVAAIQDEVAMLKRRKAPLEEKGLEELEARDQLARRASTARGGARDLEREAHEVRSADRRRRRQDRHRARGPRKRSAPASLPAIPGDTLELYESIREIEARRRRRCARERDLHGLQRGAVCRRGRRIKAKVARRASGSSAASTAAACWSS